MADGGDINIMESLFYELENYTQSAEDKEKETKKKELTDELLALREQLANNNELRKKVELFLEKADDKDLENLFKIAKIKFESGKKIDKRKLVKLVLGIVAVGGLSIVLDRGGYRYCQRFALFR